MFNKENIEFYIKKLLEEIDSDPNREGLVETPKRVAKMFCEVFEGQKYTNDEIVKLYDKCFLCDSNNLVVEKDIPCFSYCEHHIALMYNLKISIAYIPNGKVIGLSKMARVADLVCKRLQLQERIGEDIAYIISKICDTPNVAVIITGEHSCMTARGIKKPGTVTKTATLKGLFNDNPNLRQELYQLLK